MNISNNTTKGNSNDFFSHIYNNYRPHIIFILITVVIFFISDIYLDSNGNSNQNGITINNEEIKNKNEKEQAEIKHSLEKFIDTESINDLRKITNNNIENFKVWIYPPNGEYEWEESLIDLPKEVKKFSSELNPWKIERILKIDTLENGEFHIRIKFTE